jgi:DNA primase
MAFPAQFIDEVRARIGLADVVGRRVKLVRRGREHSGLCPFHQEKSPSFTLNEDKGFFHCFGCGKHGSVFDFVMETEGLNFPEAVEKLALEAGLQIPEQSPQAAAQAKAQAGLYDVMELAAEWFQEQLTADAGQGARGYLRDRGVGKQAMDDFRMGFAPESRNALKNYLLARQVSEADIIEAGLAIKPDDGKAIYDRFRNRLMFPITDRRDRVIAFGGRALGEAKAKYLNSPETPLFHKGRILYNFAQARPQVRESGKVIVAEGYMDVVAMAEGGFPYAVAPLGTAVTEDQLHELWKLAAEPIFCLDGDRAGWQAAIRAAERALPVLKPGYSLRFALLPEGEDPDTLVRGKGPEALQQILDDALPLSEVIWRKHADGQQLETPERRAGFKGELLDTARTIKDQTVRDYYFQYFNDRMEKSFGGGNRGGGARNSGGNQRQKRGAPPFPGGKGGGRWQAPEQRLNRQQGLGDPSMRRIRLLLVTILNHPDMIERISEELSDIEIRHEKLDRLRAEIIDIAGRGATLDISTLRTHLNERGLAAVVEALTGNKVTIIDHFAKAEATLEEAEAGWRDLLALDHRNVGLSQQRQEFTAERLAATEEAGAGDQFVKGMQQVVDEEQQLVRDLSRD